MPELMIYIARAKWPEFVQDISRELPPMNKRSKPEDRVKHFMLESWHVPADRFKPGSRLFVCGRGRVQAYAEILYVQKLAHFFNPTKHKLRRIWNGKRRRYDRFRHAGRGRVVRTKANARTLRYPSRFALRITVKNEWTAVTLCRRNQNKRDDLFRYIKPFRAWHYVRFRESNIIPMPLTDTPEYTVIRKQKKNTSRRRSRLRIHRKGKIRRRVVVEDLTDMQYKMYVLTGSKYLPPMSEDCDGNTLAIFSDYRRDYLRAWKEECTTVWQTGPGYYTHFPSGERLYTQRKPNWPFIEVGSEYNGKTAPCNHRDKVRYNCPCLLQPARRL